MKHLHLLPVLLFLLLVLSAGAESSQSAIAAQPGDESGTVQAVQTRLTILGYYTGDVTGRYGSRTESAVVEFETDFGFDADGILTVNEYNALMEAKYRPLRYGSSGDDVKRLQIRLANLGYYKGKISGHYLDATQEAVRAFQDKMGTVMTGEADPDTQALLFGSTARSSVQSSIKGSTTPTPQPVDEVIQVPDGDADVQQDSPQLTPSPTAAYEGQLKKGSSGERVKQVQQRLTDLMYYTGPISGSYQDKTVAAVKRFQQQNGLKADGKVGRDTWNALFNSATVVPPDATPCPTAEPTPEPDPAFHITVDVTNQVVTVYARDAAGEYTQVVRQMICSSGTKTNPSSLGNFTLNGRKATWCYFPAWGDYARYWTQITPYIAFHSVIYMKVDTMSLSVKSYRKLGTRASHGCIRLLVSDAKWIYDNVKAGTVVTITEDLPADPELRASVKQPSLNTSNMLPVSTPQPTPSPVYVRGAVPPLPLKKLQKNDSSQAVWWLQQKLTDLGYYQGKCSGTYLDGTANAVKAFQRDHGIRVTGVADVATLQVLYADELALAETTTAPPSATPAPAGN